MFLSLSCPLLFHPRPPISPPLSSPLLLFHSPLPRFLPPPSFIPSPSSFLSSPHTPPTANCSYHLSLFPFLPSFLLPPLPLQVKMFQYYSPPSLPSFLSSCHLSPSFPLVTPFRILLSSPSPPLLSSPSFYPDSSPSLFLFSFFPSAFLSPFPLPTFSVSNPLPCHCPFPPNPPSRPSSPPLSLS